MGVPFRPCAVFCPEAAEVNSTLQFPVVQTVSGGVVPEPHTFCNLHLVGARRGIAMVVDNVASDTQVSSMVKFGGGIFVHRVLHWCALRRAGSAVEYHNNRVYHVGLTSRSASHVLTILYNARLFRSDSTARTRARTVLARSYETGNRIE